MTIGIITTKLGMDKKSVKSILVNNSEMQKVCAKMALRLLSEKQKAP